MITDQERRAVEKRKREREEITKNILEESEKSTLTAFDWILNRKLDPKLLEELEKHIRPVLNKMKLEYLQNNQKQLVKMISQGLKTEPNINLVTLGGTILQKVGRENIKPLMPRESREQTKRPEEILTAKLRPPPMSKEKQEALRIAQEKSQKKLEEKPKEQIGITPKNKKPPQPSMSRAEWNEFKEKFKLTKESLKQRLTLKQMKAQIEARKQLQNQGTKKGAGIGGP